MTQVKLLTINIYNSLKTTIKERIRLALERSGKSISDLARKLELAQPTVSGVLKRDGDPPMKYLEATATLTNQSVEWLRTGKGEFDDNVNDVEFKYGDLKTEEKLEMLVGSQKRTIELLEEKIKRLEEQLLLEKKVK